MQVDDVTQIISSFSHKYLESIFKLTLSYCTCCLTLPIFFLLVTTTVSARLTQWTNLTNRQWINRILVDHDVLWVTTMGGGIVKYNKTTGCGEFLTHTDGLTDNEATGIAYCGDQIWVGGKNYGIDVYENGKFTNFNVANDGLKSNYFNLDIEVDKSGNVWIAGLAAIYKYDGKNFGSYYLPWWELSSNGIICELEFDIDGNLWFCGFCFGKITPEGEVIVIDKAIFNDSYHTTDIAVADDGVKWIASGGGLYKYDGSDFSHVIKFTGIMSLDIDSENHLWYGDVDGRLVKYFDAQSEIHVVPSEVEDDFVTTVVCDNDIVWVGMRKSGLWKFENDRFEHIDFGIEQLSLINTNGIVANREGNAIFTTSEGAMMVSHDGQFQKLISANDSAVLYIDKSDVMWLGTNDGSDTCLIRIDENDTTFFTTDNSPLKSHNINVIHSDVAKNLWIGTNYGLMMYDGKRWKEFNTQNSSLSADRIVDITSYGTNVWVSTYFHGLNRIVGDEITLFDKSNSGIPSDFTRSIIFDDNGVLWCATCDDSDPKFEMSACGPEFGHGLTKFDGSNWTNYNTHNSSIQSNTIMDIEIDKYGNIWLATMGDCGLTCFDGNTEWTNFNTWNSGISHNCVNAIAIDPNTDIIWLDHWSPEGVSAAKIDMPPTAIHSVHADSVVVNNGAVYDILGRKVERANMVKGQIYIQNGKKSVVLK